MKIKELFEQNPVLTEIQEDGGLAENFELIKESVEEEGEEIPESVMESFEDFQKWMIENDS